jgi:hypothetical protein
MCYYIENSGIFEEQPTKSVYSQDTYLQHAETKCYLNIPGISNEDC